MKNRLVLAACALCALAIPSALAAKRGVQIVERFPDSCGKWQIVERFPDYKIRIVNAHPDFTIRYVSAFPGVN